MPEMKDSGIEWIGSIPIGWDVFSVKYAVKISNGSDPKTEGDIPVYGSGTKSFKTCGEYKEGPSVLLGRKGTIDIPQYVEGKYWNVDTAFDVKAISDMNLRYFYYVSTCFDYNRYVTQTALPSMTQSNYNNIRMPKISAMLQERIATFLDSKCSEIDALSADIQKELEILEEYKKSVITEAVTKGLDPNVEMRDSGVEWIGKIPCGWKLTKLKYLLSGDGEGLKVGPFGSSFTNKTIGDGEYLVYGQANVISRDFSSTKNSVDEDTYNRLKRYEVVSGDICLSVIGNGTIGWCKTVPDNIKKGIMDSHLMKIRLSEKMINPYFELVYSKHYAGVCHTQMQYEKTGIAMEGLNGKIVKNLWMPLPSVEEQEAIVSAVMPKIELIDETISEKQKQCELLKQYKRTIIYEYVTGKKEVPVDNE